MNIQKIKQILSLSLILVIFVGKLAVPMVSGEEVPPSAPPPPLPPPPPNSPVENSEEDTKASDNRIDIIVDTSRWAGMFAFPQN